MKKCINNKIKAIIGERRAGDPSKLIASSDKARKMLVWNPTRTNIENIIKDAWLWHDTHKNGYNQ
ncbi:hypothetical protein AB2T85_03585 [Clostridium butyricum]|uniref:hypothetical protein n=1 Tax=Clostridium butyricum TaxID=1492 RepID=UPI003467A528